MIDLDPTVFTPSQIADLIDRVDRIVSEMEGHGADPTQGLEGTKSYEWDKGYQTCARTYGSSLRGVLNSATEQAREAVDPHYHGCQWEGHGPCPDLRCAEAES